LVKNWRKKIRRRFHLLNVTFRAFRFWACQLMNANVRNKKGRTKFVARKLRGFWEKRNARKKRVVSNDRYPCVECTRGGVFLVGRQVAVTWRKAQKVKATPSVPRSFSSTPHSCPTLIFKIFNPFSPSHKYPLIFHFQTVTTSHNHPH